MVKGRERRLKKIIFFVILAVTLFPIGAFSFKSIFFHQIDKIPKLREGVLDLQGYEFSDYWGIPLDGEWEFYYGHWIITEGFRPEYPDDMIFVPESWNAYRNLDLKTKGIASYRIVIKNCPGGEKLLAYIPGDKSIYRTYINGEFAAGFEDIGLGGESVYAPEKSKKEIFRGIEVKPGNDVELIIEITGFSEEGLSKVPVLSEEENRHVQTDSRRLHLAVVVGILAVTIGCIAVLTVMRDGLISSYALLTIDVIVFVRILFQNNYFQWWDPLFFKWDFYISVALRIVTLFLPIGFLHCVNQLVHIKLDERKIRGIALFEVCCVPFFIWGEVCDRTGLVLGIGIVSCLPFLYVMWMIYQGVKQNIAYSLEVSAVLMFVISSILVSALDNTGWLITEVNLFPPTCFMLSMLFQLTIFFRRSVEVQHQAFEAENLRLRLKESESDLMLSQIKPHFLYNTLLVIHMLCTTEPETAAETVLKFADFLRANLNFSSRNQVIRFAQELVHIQNYVDIERLRHKDRLNVIYEIGTAAFMVPVLCIQPLVENAIRHGACKNIEGGTVVLRTKETECDFIIEVVDDGPGFNPEILSKPFETAHGLHNIQFRLKAQLSAELRIDSIPDKGTCVTVKLPKGKNYEDNSYGG